MAITITVGRNIKGSVPMSTDLWADFREELSIAVRNTLGAPYFEGVGEGNSEQWGREDAFTIVADEPQFSDTRAKLYAELARLGRFYGQDAVAVTEGVTSFL